MKTESLLFIGLAGFAAYMLWKKNNGAGTSTEPSFTPIAAGTVTPAGNTVSSPINSTAEGVDYINKMFNQSPQLVTAPNLRSTQGSYRILAPRKGGGYTQVGASNVTLRENPKYNPTASFSKNSAGQYTINNTAKASPSMKAPWNQYH